MGVRIPLSMSSKQITSGFSKHIQFLNGGSETKWGGGGGSHF
jgi:hypothetical protein